MLYQTSNSVIIVISTNLTLSVMKLKERACTTIWHIVHKSSLTSRRGSKPSYADISN